MTTDPRYYKWLAGQVIPGDHEYSLLLECLHLRNFEWTVENDANRFQDGIALRLEYAREYGRFSLLDSPDDTCSVLEMMVALVDRIVFQTVFTSLDHGPYNWFQEILENTRLDAFTDSVFQDDPDKTKARVNHILDRLIHRRYAYNGDGGMFPLKHPVEDQRDTEIWDQMSAYLVERGDYLF